MKILCFSDTHIGSRGGLLRPGFSHNDFSVTSPVGTKMWKILERALKRRDYDAVFFLGDLMHGIPKNSVQTNEVLLPSLELQQAAAIYSLKDILPEDVPKYACTGSHYHDSSEYPLEQKTLEELGFKIVKQFKSVMIGKMFVNLAHGKGTRENLATYLEKTYKMMRSMGIAPQIILRGHYHRFAAIRFQSALAVCLPCLEDSSKRYSMQVSAYPFSSDIGVLIIDKDLNIEYIGEE
ncbi:MAG: hypothetical protein QIT35_gp10 [Methanophagales virus PBV299]|uniref:Calcineurin-like phosphoesterase domain-containing protein n=1 Tax=Methanophagales virus PBV299 TaxID=2987730 RepID=A0ABY6GLB4_9CAUD|nr:MAG: hypothetical protein QIT35_gp10 [Methanophagales virus PBV299]UYL64806.1 MAG: hypothetical protein OFDIEDLO_00010 [Methanophagales virus PBV299]